MSSKSENIDKNLSEELRKIIEKVLGKEIEKMESLERTEVFFVVYKSLALLLKRDFDVVNELTVVEITQNKEEELKQAEPPKVK